jgi:hypothetical protein
MPDPCRNTGALPRTERCNDGERGTDFVRAGDLQILQLQEQVFRANLGRMQSERQQGVRRTSDGSASAAALISAIDMRSIVFAIPQRRTLTPA